MSLETKPALKLPVIDFTSRDLKPGTVEWDLVSGDMRRALEEYGCFEALFDKVTAEHRKAVFEASEDLFRLPLETKQRTVSEVKYKGYVGQNPTNPLYEGVGIDVADHEENVKSFTQKLWPQGNKNFSDTVLSFTKNVSELDFKIRRMVMESFRIDENYIDEHLKSTKCLMRMMKYRGVDETEEELGMEAHTDRNVLTIVCQNDVADGGLEVKIKDGSHWIKANPSKDSSFLVIGGSILHVLLNGRVQFAVHRVVRMGTETRYSAGLFSMPNTEDLICAPDEMVDAEYPRLFNPFDFEAYYKFTCEGSGRRDLSGLKTYCSLFK
ncbi:PREDICTED: probable 2-oxoglutarate-dependent dioxygenase AOP1 [Camelina sativa]|uniref:Probable 2-oxoglutarate-dependent dioxygenase AOP1 n=1 Tax=Camelina sativa TaxID=90675 RepID=A0ABM0YHD7_CAMSA|nr:PREDICTED: probable 2-oxoglutarate-dependent dioxygenase AOP1 [Camelina sativa]